MIVTVPAARSTSTCSAPRTEPTAPFTFDTQCPHVIPSTWYVVTVIVFTFLGASPIILYPHGVYCGRVFRPCAIAEGQRATRGSTTPLWASAES